MRRILEAVQDAWQQVDRILLALCCTASVFGLLLIASATHYRGSNRFVLVQFCALLLGMVAYMLISFLDIEQLLQKWKWLAAFNIGLIALLLTPLGVTKGGNRAWLDLPRLPVNMQPAEVVKLTFILLLAKQLAQLRQKKDLSAFPNVIQPVGHTLLLFGYYYVVSSDMGSGLVYLFVFLAMAFVAGMAARWFVLGLGGVSAGIFALWLADALPSHIRDRIEVLFTRDDPLGVGWQQERGILALGSGRLTGQGLFQGTQTQSPYSTSLPERHNDFIFCVCGEELGMLGCLAVLAILAAIILRIFYVARHAKTGLEALICVGVGGMLMTQVLFNVGMCLYVLPVIGLTLPFFSYGGSSLLTLFMAMGLVSGVEKRSEPDWLQT